MPVEDYRSFLAEHENIDILFVNDGSTDGTQALLSVIQKEHPATVQILSLKKNAGKAEAVRRGILEALQKERYAHVAYFDADLATPLTQVFPLHEALLNNGTRMSFGSRVKRLGVEVERNALRHYVGRIFATEASILLGLPVYDTQCGAKMFSTDLAAKLFHAPFLSRWFFDVEIFFRLKGYCRGDTLGKYVIEVPLGIWIEKGDTKIRWTDFLCAPLELLRIYFAYRA
jgi:glycosyltransferase involved in cell wall biosynthesis